jgi:hypothetical protein
MKGTQSALLNSNLAAEAQKLGAAVARSRIARGVKQDLAALGPKEKRRRARELSKREPDKIDF